MARSCQTAAAVAVLLLAGVGCDGASTRDYVIESDSAVWAVPLPPYPGRLDYFAGNEARWVPARSSGTSFEDLGDEQALYRVSTIAGLNETPHHPVAVFRPGREWAMLCPQGPEGMQDQPQAAEACLRSVSSFETGSVWTGGISHGEARAKVELPRHALGEQGSPPVICRGDDAVSASCSVEVSASALRSCTVKIVRLWGPAETDSHEAKVEVSAGSADGTSMLEWSLFPSNWMPENLHESVANKRRRDVPPNTFALFSCERADDEQLRFVGAPVVAP